MAENCWSLKCLICGFTRCSLVPMQQHAMSTHCRTRDDLRLARRREVPGGYMFRGEYLDARYVWTFPDGVDWLSAQKANVIIRGWSDSVLQFEDGLYLQWVAVDRVTTGPLIAELAARHAAVLGAVHMIEFEFMELPESERFFRFGTDPTGMVEPAALAAAAAAGFADPAANSHKVLSCPKCGSAEVRFLTDARLADRMICHDCGLVYLPDESLREFYGGLDPK